MNKGASIAAGVIVAATLAAAGGYWLGARGVAEPGGSAASVTAAANAPATAKKERKLLYYQNPMGLPDTSPTPKKDPMGMDYIPVYEGGDEDEGGAPAAANQVRISTAKVQKLGVRTEAAGLRVLDKIVRAAGRIEPDERRIFTISPKFEGYVERLHVNITGQPVGKGQPLFEVYSPELVSAQREYAIGAQGVQAMKGADSEAQSSMKQLAESALMRLKNWDISEEQLRALAKTGEAKHTLTFRSPVSGIVTEKKAVQGMRFMPGEMLYQIADLSSVWVVADVFEQDIALVRTGARAKVKINAYPDRQFDAVITYVYPTLNPATRTVSVRLEMANPQGLLKPAMFAQVEMPVGGKAKVLTVPVSAVIDSGTRQIVLVQLAQGRFEPREVKLGNRSDNYVEVLNGVAEGEQVVVAANFLIDAESNLKAALGGLGHAHGGGVPQGAAEQTKPTVVGHQAEGTLDAINADGTASIKHGPIKTLGWPGMTMDFALANPSLAAGIKPGSAISFEIVERKPGEWVITKLQAKPSTSHEGH